MAHEHQNPFFSRVFNWIVDVVDWENFSVTYSHIYDRHYYHVDGNPLKSSLQRQKHLQRLRRLYHEGEVFNRIRAPQTSMAEIDDVDKLP
jgi:hypothetical protein